MYLFIKYPDETISEDMADPVNSTNSRDCANDHFLCANNQCVVASNMCDGKDDCGDNSDETTICSGNIDRLINWEILSIH